MSVLLPEEAIVALLDSVSSPTALTPEINLFRGPTIDPDSFRPTKSVAVVQTSGLRNDRLCGSSKDHRQYTVQVAIRSDRNDYAGGLSLARACHSAVHCATSEGYYSITVREPEPYYWRADKSGRHNWTFNVELGRVG